MALSCCIHFLMWQGIPLSQAEGLWWCFLAQHLGRFRTEATLETDNMFHYVTENRTSIMFSIMQLFYVNNVHICEDAMTKKINKRHTEGLLMNTMWLSRSLGCAGGFLSQWWLPIKNNHKALFLFKQSIPHIPWHTAGSKTWKEESCDGK